MIPQQSPFYCAKNFSSSVNISPAIGLLGIIELIEIICHVFFLTLKYGFVCSAHRYHLV